jgi:hypothetical protein
MNVEIGAEAALFPEKEYINGIAVAEHGIACSPHPPLVDICRQTLSLLNPFLPTSLEHLSYLSKVNGTWIL